jgi:hypothetical protein
MCKWGTDVPLEVTIPAHLSYTGEARKDVKGIDACIAPIVAALNAAGIETWQSCCGHGEAPGRIDLADGRVLFVVATRSLLTQHEHDILREYRDGNMCVGHHHAMGDIIEKLRVFVGGSS